VNAEGEEGIKCHGGAAWIGGAFGFLNDLTSRSKETTGGGGGGGWWSDGSIASFIMGPFQDG